MRWSWRASWLLPIAQAVAEGGWITVVYAALAILARDVPAIGPFEMALLAGSAMAWGRRGRWTGPRAGRIGLSVLVVLGGAIGWLLAPDARNLLLAGEPLAAIRTHPEGWVAALAVLRGAGYADPETDEARADLLMRWILPLLAIPWLVGGLVAQLLGGALVAPFTAAAFIGTVAFAVGGFLAGALIEYALLRRRNLGAMDEVMLIMIGVMIILQNGELLLWGGVAKAVPSPFSQEPLVFGMVSVSPIRLFVLCTALVLLGMFYLLIERTRLGLAMRATFQDTMAAKPDPPWNGVISSRMPSHSLM